MIIMIIINIIIIIIIRAARPCRATGLRPVDGSESLAEPAPPYIIIVCVYIYIYIYTHIYIIYIYIYIAYETTGWTRTAAAW